MIDTIIFDLDGTLLNTLEDLQDSTNFALKEFGYQERNIEEIRLFVGNGVAKLIERAIPQGLDNPNFEKCLAIFQKALCRKYVQQNCTIRRNNRNAH